MQVFTEPNLHRLYRIRSTITQECQQNCDEILQPTVDYYLSEAERSHRMLDLRLKCSEFDQWGWVCTKHKTNALASITQTAAPWQTNDEMSKWAIDERLWTITYLSLQTRPINDGTYDCAHRQKWQHDRDATEREKSTCVCNHVVHMATVCVKGLNGRHKNRADTVVESRSCCNPLSCHLIGGCSMRSMVPSAHDQWHNVTSYRQTRHTAVESTKLSHATTAQCFISASLSRRSLKGQVIFTAATTDYIRPRVWRRLLRASAL